MVINSEYYLYPLIVDFFKKRKKKIKKRREFMGKRVNEKTEKVGPRTITRGCAGLTKRRHFLWSRQMKTMQAPLSFRSHSV